MWDLPDIRANSAAFRALGLLANDWQLSGIWTASTGSPYTIGVSYDGGATGNGNQNITGSPDYGGLVRLVGDTGGGCSGDVYRQFNAAAFQGPLVGSVGLESGADYLRGCFQSVLDTNGNLLPARSRPRGAGFGVATEYQAARSIQAQVRFSF